MAVGNGLAVEGAAVIALVVLLALAEFTPVRPAQADRASEAIRQSYQSGEQALQHDDLKTAEAAFLRVLSLAPSDVGSRVNLGVVYMREQNWAKALEFLGQAEKLAPQIPGIRLNIGLAYYRQSEYARAIPPFESVLRDQPDSQQARRLLGLSYLFEEHYLDAANTLADLWPIANGDLSYLYSLAVASQNAGRHDLEDRALSRLLEVGKDSPALHLFLGKAYLNRNHDDEALAEFEMAAQRDPKLPLVHYNLGVAYKRKREWAKAKEEFLQDIANEPDIAYNYDELGTVCYQLEQNQQAQEFFHEAIKRDRKLETSWFGLAKIYKQQGRMIDALQSVDQARSLAQNSASVHYLRAHILKQLGRTSEARNEMAIVQRLQRDNNDRLQKEVEGSKYRDPQMLTEQE